MKESKNNIGGFDSPLQGFILERKLFPRFFEEEIHLDPEIVQEDIEELILSGFYYYLPESLDINEQAKFFIDYALEAKLFMKSPVIQDISLQSLSQRAREIVDSNNPNISQLYPTGSSQFSNHSPEFWLQMHEICLTATEIGKNIETLSD